MPPTILVEIGPEALREPRLFALRRHITPRARHPSGAVLFSGLMPRAIVLIIGVAGRQPRRCYAITDITVRTGHSCGSARAGVRSFPGPIRMRLTNPTAILTSRADHASSSAPFSVEPDIGAAFDTVPPQTNGLSGWGQALRPSVDPTVQTGLLWDNRHARKHIGFPHPHKSAKWTVLIRLCGCPRI
jgi:hypothetical protein